jgi:hypothetical protein
MVPAMDTSQPKSKESAGSEKKDPYQLLPGIPKGSRPPTHYELLGLSSKEPSTEVIAAAAKRREMLVEECRGTEYNQFANRLLYEIEEARFCLLSPNMRQQYDEMLSARQKKQSVGEGNELVRNDFGSLGILLVVFIIMVAASFTLPWDTYFTSNSKTPIDSAGSATPAQNQQAGKPVGGWVDLLASIDIPSQAINGEWRRSGPGVLADALKSSCTSMQLSIPHSDRYDFETEFTFREFKQDAGVVISLPVGASRCQVALWPPDWCQLKRVVIKGTPGNWRLDPTNGRSSIHRNGKSVGSYWATEQRLGFNESADGAPIAINLNDRCRLTVKVGQDDFKHTLSVTLNGRKVLEWSGLSTDISEIHEPGEPDLWKNRPREGLAIGGSANTVVEFHSAKIRPR